MGQSQSTDESHLMISPGATADEVFSPTNASLHNQNQNNSNNTNNQNITNGTYSDTLKNTTSTSSSLTSPRILSPSSSISSTTPHPTPIIHPDQALSPSHAPMQTSPMAASIVSPSLQQPQTLTDVVKPLVDPDATNHDNSTAVPITTSLFPQNVEAIPTVFRWVHGGNEVYVTGSFNNWQGKIPMVKDDHDFTLKMNLPTGTHTYKYIVDHEWRLDIDAPTVSFNNFVNNIVEVKRPVFEYPPANFADSEDEDLDERKQIASYGQRAPDVNDYVQEATKLPPQLSTILLDQTNSTEPNLLPVPEHVVLNHLYVLKSNDPSLIVTGMTQRFKANSHARITHKFVTSVYYAPRNTILQTAPAHMNSFPGMNSSPTLT